MSTYTIKAGDTLHEIAKREDTSVEALKDANPGIDPKALQVGQKIKLPKDKKKEGGGGDKDGKGGKNDNDQGIPGAHDGSNGDGKYVQYSGPASNFPRREQWASYDALWKQNSRLMKFNSSDSEIALIKLTIKKVATSSRVDIRIILCIIVQESEGNPRVRTTNNDVRNPGLMQSHNGVEFDPKNPAGSILQMVRNGTEGTKHGDDLKQLYAKYGNYYETFRAYNSGSVDQKNLNRPLGATASYVRDAANRLMDHAWNGM